MLASNGKFFLAEIHFFAQLQNEGQNHFVALASFYGPPDENLLKLSYGSYYSVLHYRDTAVQVFDIKSIKSVVTLAPDPRNPAYTQSGANNRYYLMEKPGLSVLAMMGIEQEEDETEE